MGEMAKLCVSFTLLHAFYTRFTLFFGGHPDPEIRGEPGLKKNFFRPFGAHFNLKIIKGGQAPQSPPLDPPLQHTFVNVVILVFYYRFARILCDLMAYVKFLSPAT